MAQEAQRYLPTSNRHLAPDEYKSKWYDGAKYIANDNHDRLVEVRKVLRAKRRALEMEHRQSKRGSQKSKKSGDDGDLIVWEGVH
jgi:hypothetical protein